jgi:hypothetical protein
MPFAQNISRNMTIAEKMLAQMPIDKVTFDQMS